MMKRKSKIFNIRPKWSYIAWKADPELSIDDIPEEIIRLQKIAMFNIIFENNKVILYNLDGTNYFKQMDITNLYIVIQNIDFGEYNIYSEDFINNHYDKIEKNYNETI